MATIRRTIALLAYLISMSACAQIHATASHDTDDANALTGKPSVVGVYDVAMTSANPNCVWNDTVWTIDRTATAYTYRVDTNAQVSYVTASDVPEKADALAWSTSLYYTVNGCYYRVSFDYAVTLDGDGNLAGSAVVSPDANCGAATRCEYVLTSQRITDRAD